MDKLLNKKVLTAGVGLAVVLLTAFNLEDVASVLCNLADAFSLDVQECVASE